MPTMGPTQAGYWDANNNWVPNPNYNPAMARGGSGQVVVDDAAAFHTAMQQGGNKVPPAFAQWDTGGGTHEYGFVDANGVTHILGTTRQGGGGGSAYAAPGQAGSGPTAPGQPAYGPDGQIIGTYNASGGVDPIAPGAAPPPPGPTGPGGVTRPTVGGPVGFRGAAPVSPQGRQSSLVDTGVVGDAMSRGGASPTAYASSYGRGGTDKRLTVGGGPVTPQPTGGLAPSWDSLISDVLNRGGGGGFY